MAQLQLVKDAKLEFEATKDLAASLLSTKHYQSMGSENIFAIVMKARSMGIDPLEALNGGMYAVRGKVEMSAQLMNAQIRKAGHSITKDSKSDDTICILHGKRADTGDTWTESFSMDDAKRAGLLEMKTNKFTNKQEKGPWQSHPRAMLFARALSLLARQLFPDVIKGCYVEGEIQAVFDNEPKAKPAEKIEEAEVITDDRFIFAEQAEVIKASLSDDKEYEQTLLNFLQIASWEQLPLDQYDRVIRAIQKHFEKAERIA